MSINSISAASVNDTQVSYNTQLSDVNAENSYQTSESTHVLNTSSFKEYVTNGEFNEKVSDGDTIDIQGKLDSPKFALNVNKPVNIISSTNDAYIDLDTISVGTSGGYKNGMFQITSGSEGTNITGITFHNTRVWVSNTQNVCVNNISVICESSTGFGVGSFSVRNNSDNITVINSYFSTIHNGGHSNVVVAGATNSLFENNTIIADGTQGLVGNTFYLTTYGASRSNYNITIRNNTIQSIIPEKVSMATCWGLVLEGSGHTIENNYINASAAVVSQYADADYGVVTEVDSIIFRNNNIVYGSPMLVFPGEVYNNTIRGSATLSGVKAHDNNIDFVEIINNTLYENNTSEKLNVTGNNNILNNNEVYSNSDYAVVITGRNNTLTNNKLSSIKGSGDEAVSNTSDIFSSNNTGITLPRVFYINDENINEYFVDASEEFGYPDYNFERPWLFKERIYNDGDIFVFNLTGQNYIYNLDADWNNYNFDLIIENTTGMVITSNQKSITLINSFIPMEFNADHGSRSSLILINSTILRYNSFGSGKVTLINSTIISEYPKDNTYILCNYQGNTIDVSTGKLNENIKDTATILVCIFDKSNEEYFNKVHGQGYPYCEDIYLDKNLNIKAMNNLGIITSNVHLIEGSQSTKFDSITFDGNVLFETGNINFYNCTFNKDIIINNRNIIFEGCTFNGKITLNTSFNSQFINNTFKSTNAIEVLNSNNNLFKNNSINTTTQNTIIFDDNSENNIVRNNYLMADSSFGDYSVISNEYNTIEDNTPTYNTEITINIEDILFFDDNEDILITVNDIDNNKPVTKGYVEVYCDGYFVDKKELKNGQTTINLNVNDYVDKQGNYPIKVWYYDGTRYNNNVTAKTVNVVKSDVTISVDEFIAKLNEKSNTNITFLNQKDNPVQDTNITVTVGRVTYTVETVDGVATLDEFVTTEWLDAGRMTITFPDTELYNRNSTTITLNTSKADVLVTPVVSMDGNTADVELTLSDALGENVTDGRIVLSTLDGQELASGRVSNGKFISNVALPEGYSDEYLVANFTGSYYYNDFVRNVKITQMLNSTVTLETNSPLYGEELVINGKLVDSKNTPIGGANLTLNLNGSKVIVTTNDDGEYNYTYTPGLGVNSLTVTFDGTVDVYGSSASKDVTIRDTDREMNEVLDRLDELTSENAKLKEQLENLTQLSNDLKEQLANQTSELSEQNAALQQQINTLSTIISALTDIIDKQNEQIAALTAPENTTIVLNQVTDAKYKANVVISGMLNSQKGMALSGQTVTLTIGEETVDVITKNGEFEYTTVFKSVGEQTVTASYAGSDNYVASDASVTFDVAKQDVVVTVDTIADSAYGDNVTITGKFSDVDGKAISNSNVRVFVNGKKFLAKTDKTGTYTLSVKVNALGENNVTVGYAGNDNYNSYEDTTTFKADKQDVIVTVDAIEDTKVGENVTITGTFTDKNGKAIINSNVKILINGKKYYARTDSTGSYTFTTTVTSAGINNVTVGYSGNDKYNSYENVTTFNVEAQDVIVTVNPIEEVAVGDNVTITGSFTDKYGKAIINSNVKILFNGKKYYARTDSTGTYTFTTTVTTEGINNITVGYAGSAKYNAYETSTTFIAKAE